MRINMQALRIAIAAKINHYSNIIIVNITSIIKINGHKKKTNPAYNYYKWASPQQE